MRDEEGGCRPLFQGISNVLKNEPKLRPCPFCKSPVEVFIAIYGIRGSQDYYAIAHPDNTGCVIDGVETSAYSDKEELIKDWNKRIDEQGGEE